MPKRTIWGWGSHKRVKNKKMSFCDGCIYQDEYDECSLEGECKNGSARVDRE